MTRPQRLGKGRYYLITRRTLGRMFLLMPLEWVKSLFDYAVARASAESGVMVIGGCCMSTHYHLVVYDPHGDLPLFTGLLNELLARGVNAEIGRADYVFESGGPHYMPLLTAEAIVEALVYALTNPCEARLVARSRAWGGWQTQPEALCTQREVERPALVFFSERSKSPRLERLELHLPATHEALGVDGFRELVAERVKARENALKQEHGGPCLGMERVRAFNWSDTASAYERSGTRVPTAKTGRVEHAVEVHEAYRAELEVFWRDYQDAYERMKGGEVSVFPYGTYRWRVYGGQACAGPPANERAVFM